MHNSDKDNEDIRVRQTAALFWRAASKYKLELYASFLVPASAVVIGIAAPFLIGRILAGLAQGKNDMRSDVVALAITLAVGVLINRIGFLKLWSMQAKVMGDLHAMVFERLMKRSVGYHTNNISGKLISDAIDFSNAFGSLGNVCFIGLGQFIATLVVGVIVVLFSSWELGVYLLAIVTITLVWAIFESRTRANLRNRRLAATKRLTGHLSDSIVNVQTVKTFAGETREIALNLQLNNTLRNLRVSDWRRASVSNNNRMAALIVMQFALILLIIHLVRQDARVLATGIFAFTYTFNLTNRLFDLNNMTRQFEEAFLQASPITKMLSQTVELVDANEATALKVSKGAIAIQNASFAYESDHAAGEIFQDFNLNVHPGEKIGLVGPIGGGKSTLTRLLLRFEDLNSGSILIDGQNIAAVTQASLRQNVSYVPQEPLLFHRSIFDNIVYGSPKATMDKVILAAKQAKAHSFIESLPNGYNTLVGERGIKLSGGQRQRVAIARAILKNAPILVLDEATSALDSENEKQVQAALWQLMEGRTAIVVAHRLSTIQKMDRIIVLDDGKIVEEGNHHGLLKQKGAYATLWAHQSGGFIED